MRILHVLHTADPVAGGPPNVVTRLATAQALSGHQVQIASFDRPSSLPRIKAFLEELPGSDRLIHHSLPAVGPVECVLARRARRHLETLMPAIDVAHIHELWSPLSPVAAAAARAFEVPYVFSAHGALNPWALKQDRLKYLKKRIALALRFHRMLDEADALHYLNAAEERFARPVGLPGPTIVIPNGVDPGELEPRPEPGAFGALHPQLNGRRFILFLSRLHRVKGLEFLADAFRILCLRDATTHLVVAGPDGGAGEGFAARIDAAGLSDRVHLVGPIYGRDKLAALVDAACFCLPSRQEGFSIAILEALACGLPVVISKGCHFPEVAEAGAGEVVPLDSPRIAEALEKVLGDDEARGRMGEAGRKLVETRFTWSRIAATFVETYEGIIARRAG